MGYATTWCAVPVGDKAVLLRHLGLTPSDGADGGRTSDAFGVAMEHWYVVHAEEYDWSRLSDSTVRSIAAETDLLICRIEEHVMASSAELWSRGSRRWAVWYSGEDGVGALSAAGTPPDTLVTIRAEREAAQRESVEDSDDIDHVFEVPLLLAESITGYRHDDDTGERTEELVELE